MDQKIILLILGTIIGGLITFTGSYFMWKVQLQYNRSKIAQGFYLEICSLAKTIELYAKAFDSPGPGAGLVRVDQLFYRDGLFFTFRKEIFAFNRDPSKKPFQFYTCLLRVAEARQVVPSDPFSKPANDAMKDHIKEAYSLPPNLNELLKKEFS